VVGGGAVAAMVIVGCTTVTRGEGRPDAAAAPEYRASVSASVAASIAASRSREAERQRAVTREAVHSACDTLAATSVDAVAAVNEFVDAINAGDPDAGRLIGPAADALHRSAELVDGAISDPLSPELRDALADWVDAANRVAQALLENYGPDEFNAEVSNLNDVRSVALDLCDSAYRFR